MTAAGASAAPLLVLRPEPGASRTVARARALGLEAIAVPLFTIVPVAFALPDPLPEALLLTSANAARALGGRGARLAEMRVYAVGAETAAAARAAGFADIVTGDADAAAIVARAARDGVSRLLHLAGRAHRAVAHPGVAIEPVIVYRADPVAALPEEAAAALARGAVALLHSPRAARLFRSLASTRGRIACLSPAVADAAGEGWRAVAVAARPTDALLLAAAARLCDSERGG